MATFMTDYTVDEILDELSYEEKQEMLDALVEDLDKEELCRYEQEFKKRNVAVLISRFRELSDFDKRKFLADALYVPSYYDDDALKSALRPIITAR